MTAARLYRGRVRWVGLACVGAALAVAGVALWPKAPAQPALSLAFTDMDGRPVTLGNFRGKVLLINLWATWCAPCRQEMPSLDRLEAKLGGSRFQVVPVSVDRGGVAIVRRFYEQVGVRHLAIFLDPSGAVLRQAAARGLPTTLLIDGEGQEIRRVVGPAEWDSAEVVDALEKALGAGKQAPR